MLINMNLWLIFLTGLTSGGVTCAAMQGGLLASTIANQKTPRALPSTFAFLTTKLIAHVILGALLGYLGQALAISLALRLLFQGIAAFFMLASAANLLELHPSFRYLAFTPPTFARRLIKSSTISDQLYAPAILGLFTILIPCGVTQAIEVTAVGTGSLFAGALTMGVFILGTVPMFVLIGLLSATMTQTWKTTFTRAAAALLIILSLSSINGILQVLDSPYSVERLGPRLVALLPPYDESDATPFIKQVGGVQKITIAVSNNGYTPRYFKVKQNIPVELTLQTTGSVFSCATSFTFKAFGIADLLGPQGTKVHTFTPTKPGTYTYACSMGMYSGTMEVI